MTKQPKMGIVYRIVFAESRKLQVPLYHVKNVRKRTRAGKSYTVPNYALAGFMNNREMFVPVDHFKSKQGHNEIYVFTSAGLGGWMALHVDGFLRTVSFHECEVTDENEDRAD